MCKELSFALLLVPGVASDWGQIHQAEASPTAVPQTAFTYFDEVEGHRFDEFLHRLRPKRLPPERKEQVLKILPQRDVVSASPARRPSFALSSRSSNITTEGPQSMSKSCAPRGGDGLSCGGSNPHQRARARDPLRRRVAGHCSPTNWGTSTSGTSSSVHASRTTTRRLQELELRCDGIAVITLIELGLNPEKVLTSFEKFNAYNGYKESGTRAERYVSSRDRERFIRSMIALVRGQARHRGPCANRNGLPATCRHCPTPRYCRSLL